MKKYSKYIRAFLLFSFCFATLLITTQVVAQRGDVQARVVRRMKKTAAPVPSAPVATLTYNVRRHLFALRVTWVKKVTYTIAYNKRGSDIMEAIQGTRRYSKATTFVRNVFAGSQSSRYFIPHYVTGGTLEVHGTDWQDNPFTITQTFTISKNKLIVTGP